MPNDDVVSKALMSAKSALAGAKKFTASAGDTDPSRFAAKSATASAPAKAAPKSGILQEAMDAGRGIKARMESEGAVLGSMKKGGSIKKTGLYKMHKGEEVISADEMDKATEALGSKPGRPKHGMRHTHVDSHGDGSHTVRHTPYEGDEISYAVKDTPELQAKIKEYLGDPSSEESAEA